MISFLRKFFGEQPAAAVPTEAESAAVRLEEARQWLADHQSKTARVELEPMPLHEHPSMQEHKPAYESDLFGISDTHESSPRMAHITLDEQFSRDRDPSFAHEITNDYHGTSLDITSSNHDDSWSSHDTMSHDTFNSFDSFNSSHNDF